jgi:isoamylase
LITSKKIDLFQKIEVFDLRAFPISTRPKGDNVDRIIVSAGYPQPYGLSFQAGGYNFAIFSKQASNLTLCLFYEENQELFFEKTLDIHTNKTGHVWHIHIEKIDVPFLYAYRIDEQLLLDPYAKGIYTGRNWNSPQPYFPLGAPISPQSFDWEEIKQPLIPSKDLILYEMHVRGFTFHSSSQVHYPGGFLGVIEKIPYLIDLGVNAIELLPVFEFNESEYQGINPATDERLCQYWGYSTVNFFSPMARYASSNDPKLVIFEFKTMVKELHRHGIEVILDVVFNHTAEGGIDGPKLSFKGLENSVYYMLSPEKTYLDFTGCGHTLNVNHPVVIEFILDVLRYWVLEMHVDGFRFDLASIFYRDLNGAPICYSPIVEAFSKDPLLANTKLISEPWDAVGLYHVGSFYPFQERWSEWNGKYRDSIRRFIKGTIGKTGRFATRLCGSQDLYGNLAPSSSINFVTAHDGFTLRDLVSYNSKHNLENGENNRDGTNNNDSWNCGVEGETDDPEILALRERQMKNFHLALMVSQGIPMILMGDEYGHTKRGNNNTWCQDNELNWFLWNKLETNSSFFQYYRFLIHFRRAHPLLRYGTFLSSEDIQWHGQTPFHPEWNSGRSFIAFTLIDQTQGRDLFIAFNAGSEEIQIELPLPPKERIWSLVINTGNFPPEDFFEEETRPFINDLKQTMRPYSAIMLKAH